MSGYKLFYTLSTIKVQRKIAHGKLAFHHNWRIDAPKMTDKGEYWIFSVVGGGQFSAPYLS